MITALGLDVEQTWTALLKGKATIARQSGVIAVRPEAISLGAAEGLDYRFTGRVQNKIYLGDQTEFSIATAELGDILVRAANSSAPVAGGLAHSGYGERGARQAGRTGRIGRTSARVAPDHMEGTPWMYMTRPSIGDRTSSVFRPSKSVA